MVLDTIAQSAQYIALSPGFAPAFTFLRQVREDMALGRHEIDGDRVFALVQKYVTKPYAESQYEAHRKYIDVQFILYGREFIYWAPLPQLTEMTMPFDETKDAALYRIIPEGVAVPVNAGQFAILFPEDGHAPACARGEPSEVMKVVVKVKI